MEEEREAGFKEGGEEEVGGVGIDHEPSQLKELESEMLSI